VNKLTVLELLDCSQAELARVLGISRAAVAQWPADRPIPERQMLRLKHELRADAFANCDEPVPGIAIAAHPTEKAA